ncbi:hypothetical protein [Bordetella bronchialis]|uniref:Protein kinase domain-containing protein n=1 Tax=Bordetella bronchialis TaxID=463025 RepID=A0A193G5V2_9BORD|nr:hypothetical protein [Bordetella bronchialis]ANN69932.1 hypothetical protein BAU06_25600 [Bordetella bronchialis]ANN75078.1 hypothetical protein BAU08_26180 [Bordetella bronchialis]
MSVSPAFMPGAEHPAPEPFGYRPLAAIAAAAAGGVPQKRIGRVVSEIAPELMAAHEQGKVHGAISVHTVGLDEFGYAHLMVPALYPDHPGSMEPASCFAAVEQFDPDPLQACGPWTDVYALCAVMCSLVSGSPPPHALARRADDQYVPLTSRRPRGYDESFLAVIDQGLCLEPAQRPQSVGALCGMLGVACVPETQEDPSAGAATAAASALSGQAASQRRGTEGRRRRGGAVAAIAAGALVVLGIWVWLNQEGDERPSGPVVLSSRPAAAPAARTPSAPPGPVAALPGAPAGSLADPRAAVPAPAPASGPGGRQDVAPAEPDAPSLPAPGQAGGAPVTEQGSAAAARPPRPANVVVKVDIQPWGEIFVDGVSRGISPPVKTLTLPAGRHTVEVRNAGLPPYRVSLDLKPGQPAAIRHVFR